MNKKNTVWCILVLITLFALNVESIYSQIKPMQDNVFYYMKIDTAGVDIGYLRMDSAGVNLKVDNVKGDYAMWYIKKVIGGVGNRYVFVNKMPNATDSLRFNPPVELQDTIAAKVPNGILKWWDDLTFNEDSKNKFLSSYKKPEIVESFNYNLTMMDDGVVTLSSDTSSMQYKPLKFIVERVTVLPDSNKYYRLAVDTAGIPNINSVSNYLYTDTTVRHDSIAVSITENGDPGLWKFVADTIIRDTTYFKIYNKKTDSILAFDIPENDTIAYTRKTGKLNQWMIPFFIEDNGTGKFLVRDTVTHKKYYLGLKGNSVILTSDTLVNKCMKFVLVDESSRPFIPDTSIVDSTKIYKVKYLNGADSGRYLGSDFLGIATVLDTVFPHIPEGQFVVSRTNKNSLMNRVGNVRTDSLFFVCDTLTGDTIEGWFTNRTDTFEIVNINYGNIDIHKSNPRLGYKYITSEDINQYSYVISYTSIDTLNNATLGYDPTDSLAILMATGDTVKYILEPRTIIPVGAPAIAGIPQIQRDAYYLHLLDNDSLYSSIKSGKLVVDTVPHQVSFFIKEDTVVGKFFLVENTTNKRKVLVDSTRHVNLVPIDSIVTHHFILTQAYRRPLEEPDPYVYLTTFPDNKGKGLYELKIVDPISLERKWLTKNISDYAVLAKEGESMLRAGSFTQYDLHLWIDIAQGTGIKPDRSSFYIVKDIDTLNQDINGYNTTGYFMHVMDSTSIASHDEYVYIDGDTNEEFNRANFVRANRFSAYELLLASGASAQLRDSVGFAGKNEEAINEYRFFLQKVDTFSDEYYIVTEAGYGDSGRTNARGYLSVSNNIVYFGPRDKAARVSFLSSTVSNEVVKPPLVEEIKKNIAIIGGTGQITIRNAMGQDVDVFNILGQSVAKRTLSSDNETIPAKRGIVIVKTETKTQKVVVK